MKKEKTPNNYSVTEKAFISQYTGIGGLGKYDKGNVSRDVGQGKERDYGLDYEYFTPTELCRLMWGLAYKHSGDMQIKDVFRAKCRGRGFY